MKKVKFGATLVWMKAQCAETEFIRRLMKAADEIDAVCVPIDNYGHILDDNFEATDKTANDLDFILSLHYDTPKLVDNFYYHALWNPPEIPLSRKDYDKIIDNYISNDDFLIYDNGSMNDHLKSILKDSPRYLENASSLMASFPESSIMPPNLNNPMLFYCGMNWDILSGKGRNEGVLKLLDRAKVIKIFGPNSTTNESWGGIHPWEGFECYQYPIPFDGFSLLNELNKCGVCLVLSSDAHRRAGAVTNRAFEACAAGAVMISDNNPGMRAIFGDAALYVEYNKTNPQDTFDQIMEKYNWILNHKYESEQLVKKAQEIFKKKCSLNLYLKNIIKNHDLRVKAVKDALYAKSDCSKVLVTYICQTDNTIDEINKVKYVIKNINNQCYNNIKLVIACDVKLVASLNNGIIDSCCKDIEVKPMEILDSGGNKVISDGLIINELRKINHDYFIMTNSVEIWFKDHVTTLVRTLEDDTKASFSSSAQFNTSNNNERYINTFQKVTQTEFYNSNMFQLYPYPGCFMFRASCHTIMPCYLLNCLDGHEHIAYVQLLVFNFGQYGCFSKRVSFGKSLLMEDKRNNVISFDREERYILGLSKFYIEQAVGNINNEKQIKDLITKVPLKSYLKMRCMKFIINKTSDDRWINHFALRKYREYESQYYNLW